MGTIKNRMAELRWWAEKIGKQNVIARDNDHYGIGNRQYVTNVSKARQLTGGDLARIMDPYTAMSLRLQAAFGLRRGESIKIRPEWADRGDRLALWGHLDQGWAAARDPDPQRGAAPSSTRPGAGRQGSLIPAERSYVRAVAPLRVPVRGGRRAPHPRPPPPVRADRYRELTGWPAPAAGGPVESSRPRSARPTAKRGSRSAKSWGTSASRSRRCISADEGRPLTCRHPGHPVSTADRRKRPATVRLRRARGGLQSGAGVPKHRGRRCFGGFGGVGQLLPVAGASSMSLPPSASNSVARS